MSHQKYKIGDKVFNPDKLFHINNPYDYKLIYKFQTVKSANHNYFSFKENGSLCGRSVCSIFDQKNGWDGWQSWYLHCIKDKEEIERLIKEAFKKEVEIHGSKTEDNISRKLLQIQNLNEEVTDLRKNITPKLASDNFYDLLKMLKEVEID